MHPAASRLISIKYHPFAKMRIHARKSSSCSDLKSKAAPLKYISAEEGPGEVLSAAGEGNTMESKSKELNNTSALRSVPITSNPWKNDLQPLSTKQWLVPRESFVTNNSAAINTDHSDLSVVKSDLKRAMNKRHSHAGFFYQNSHQNDVTFDVIPKAPALALLTEIPPESIMPRMPPIPKSLSLDRIPSIRHLQFSDSNSGALNSKSSYRPQVAGAETLRKRDELASVFRSLDGEFQK